MYRGGAMYKHLGLDYKKQRPMKSLLWICGKNKEHRGVMGPGFKVEKVSFSYHRSQKLFSDLSFQLAPGEVRLLVGGNGQGKTTLLRGLVGLLTLKGGEVRWEGMENLEVMRQNLSYLAAEDHGVVGYLSAYENLLYFIRGDGRSLASGDPSRVMETLRYWGFLSPYVRSYLAVECFSTGMKRRLALAKLQCQSRPLWLLDEPTYGLDTKGQQLLVAALKEHQQKGGMALIATHVPELFESFSPGLLSLEVSSASSEKDVFL